MKNLSFSSKFRKIKHKKWSFWQEALLRAFFSTILEVLRIWFLEEKTRFSFSLAGTSMTLESLSQKPNQTTFSLHHSPSILLILAPWAYCTVLTVQSLWIYTDELTLTGPGSSAIACPEPWAHIRVIKLPKWPISKLILVGIREDNKALAAGRACFRPDGFPSEKSTSNRVFVLFLLFSILLRGGCVFPAL